MEGERAEYLLADSPRSVVARLAAAAAARPPCSCDAMVDPDVCRELPRDRPRAAARSRARTAAALVGRPTPALRRALGTQESPEPSIFRAEQSNTSVRLRPVADPQALPPGRGRGQPGPRARPLPERAHELREHARGGRVRSSTDVDGAEPAHARRSSTTSSPTRATPGSTRSTPSAASTSAVRHGADPERRPGARAAAARPAGARAAARPDRGGRAGRLLPPVGASCWGSGSPSCTRPSPARPSIPGSRPSPSRRTTSARSTSRCATSRAARCSCCASSLPRLGPTRARGRRERPRSREGPPATASPRSPPGRSTAMRIRCHGDLPPGPGAVHRPRLHDHRLRGRARPLAQRPAGQAHARCATWRGCCARSTTPPSPPCSTSRPAGWWSPIRTPRASSSCGAAPGTTRSPRRSSGAYLETSAGGAWLPESRSDLNVLLDTSLLEKAVYELTYELNNRPLWVPIALMGLRDLLG